MMYIKNKTVTDFFLGQYKNYLGILYFFFDKDRNHVKSASNGLNIGIVLAQVKRMIDLQSIANLNCLLTWNRYGKCDIIVIVFFIVNGSPCTLLIDDLLVDRFLYGFL